MHPLSVGIKLDLASSWEPRYYALKITPRPYMISNSILSFIVRSRLRSRTSWDGNLAPPFPHTGPVPPPFIPLHALYFSTPLTIPQPIPIPLPIHLSSSGGEEKRAVTNTYGSLRIFFIIFIYLLFLTQHNHLNS